MYSRTFDPRQKPYQPPFRNQNRGTSQSWRPRSFSPTHSFHRQSSKPYHKQKFRKGYRNFRQNQAHCATASNSDDDEQEEPYTSDVDSESSTEDAHLCFMAETLDEPLPHNVPEAAWILDTGATCNLTPNVQDLCNYIPLKKTFPIRFGNNTTRHALGVGTTNILLSDGKIVSVGKVYYVPKLAKNLMSVSQIAKSGTTVKFAEDHCVIKHLLPNGEHYRVLGPKIGKLYLLGCSKPMTEYNSIFVPPSPDYSTLLWHYRLGHWNHGAMKFVASEHLAKHFSLPRHSRLSLCEGCIFGKLTNTKYPVSHTQTTHPLQLIHSDLCGPLPIKSLTGNRYFITFIDDYTRFTMVTFLHEKSSGSVLKTFKTYHRLVENQLDLRITALQTDNGGEYTSHIFKDYCRKHGIHHRYTVAHNPQQNGLAECKNRTLMDLARSMLKVAALPPPFWEEAAATLLSSKSHLLTKY
ncbi:hypothetical protein L7F22_005567 [Adiantum nelumboides]|nr:hypothetical protein [Adiantum nelumboides]